MMLRLILRVPGAWLIVICWWGMWLLDFSQEHNKPVYQVWPYFLIAGISLLIASVFEKDKPKQSVIRSGYICFFTLFGIWVSTLFLNATRGYPYLGGEFFAWQAKWLFSILGQDATIQGSTLITLGKKITYDLIKSGSFLIIAFLLQFIALVFCSISSYKKKLYAIIIGVIVHYGYMLFRLMWVVWVYKDVEYTGLIGFNLGYWWWTILFFFPITIAWFYLLWKFNLVAIYDKIPKTSFNDIRIMVLFSFLIIFLGASFSFYGFSKPKPSVIIIDEIHSQWETTLLDFNKESIGPFADSTYHSFLDYLSFFHQCCIITNEDKKCPIERVKTIKSNKLSKELLRSFKRHPILILKCPTKEYANDEVEAIVSFVQDGGGLFLIGDHTDVYFMNTYLNKIARHFGMEFEPNAIYMVDGGWVVTEKNDYRIHPITKLLDLFLWATGDSLKLRWPAYPIVSSPVVSFSDNGDYHGEYFFGNGQIDSSEVYGSFAIIAAAESGKGKVVAFTDSTCFNNYLMFTPGRRELLEGTLLWLSTGKWFDPLWILTILIFFLMFFCLIKYGISKESIIYFIIILPICLEIGKIGGMALNNLTYQSPKPIYPLPKDVLIDATHKSTHCMCVGNSTEFMDERSYESFMYFMVMIDIFPRINYKEPLVKETLDKSKVLTIVSPTKDFSSKERNDICAWVKDGGSLLLIEGQNPKSTINQIATRFNMFFRSEPFPYEEARSTMLTSPTYVEGGRAIFKFKDIPIISYTKFGNGIVLCVGDDNIFTKKGGINLIRELEFGIIEALNLGDIKALETINFEILNQYRVQPEKKRQKEAVP